MKKYNVYYTILKAGGNPINKYYWIDATSPQDAVKRANERGKEWESKGYLFKVKQTEISNWFAI